MVEIDKKLADKSQRALMNHINSKHRILEDLQDSLRNNRRSEVIETLVGNIIEDIILSSNFKHNEQFKIIPVKKEDLDGLRKDTVKIIG